jgi:outer membrane protein OmpU
MNIKKIGLTALAGSLVSMSAIAGEMSVAGGASITVEHINGNAANTGKVFKMGNQLTFSGSGELDNGLNVSLSFIIDQGDDTNASTGPFDSHSVTVSHDTFGSLTFAGEGGSSAQALVDDTATGDIWDFSDGEAAAPTSSTSDNMLTYSNSNIMDGVTLTASYVPHTSSQFESSVDWGIAYTGVEGLTIGAAMGENNTTKGSKADVTTYYGSYAYGPITVAFTQTEFDSESATNTADVDFTAFSVAYTISDELSIAYKNAVMETPNNTSDKDQETSGITAAYTTGGMTISAKIANTDNEGYSTAATADEEIWSLGASFAF